MSRGLLSQCLSQGDTCPLQPMSALTPLSVWAALQFACPPAAPALLCLCLVRAKPWCLVWGWCFCAGCALPTDHHCVTQVSPTGDSLGRAGPRLLEPVLTPQQQGEQSKTTSQETSGLSPSSFPFLMFTKWVPFEAGLVPSDISVQYLHRAQVIPQ